MSEIGTSTINRDYAYDAMNRLISAGATGEVVSYTYDERGNRTSMTLPDNSSISYGYNDKGQLISMTDWDGGESLFAYDASGRHIRTTRPNDVTSDYRYDTAGRLMRLTHSLARRSASMIPPATFG